MTNLPNDMNQPQTANRDAARAILMLTADDTEDLEFFYPYYRFIEAGFKVDVATPKGGAFKAKHGIGLQESIKIMDARPQQYEMLYIPGGKAPAALKLDEHALKLTRSFAESGKPISTICHGPQVLAAAGVIKGRKIAAWPECKDEIEQAGATYVDQESLTDGQFVSGRWPGDLPAQVKATLTLLETSAKSARAVKAAA